MEWVRRSAGWLLGIGLVAGLAWSVAVSASMPNWFDPSEACALAAGQANSAGVEVRSGWFPPRATCVFEGGTDYEFISPTRSVVLSVVGVAVAVVLLTGLALTVRRLSGEPGPIRPAEGDLRKRQRNQLMYGALDMGAVVAVVTGLNAFAIVLGGLPGGIIFACATMVGLSALGVVLDRHVGPLPSTPLASRRRGTVAGLTVFAMIVIATALTGKLPFFRLWAALVAAVTYAVVTAVQWSRLPRPRQDHETTAEHLAG